MTHHSHHSGSHTGKHILAFMAGVATILAVGGYFLYGPNGRQNRKTLERWIDRAKNEILEKMEDVKDITEDQYHKIVDEVVERYTALKEVGEEKASEISENFKQRWEEMRQAAAEARREAEAEIEEEEAARS